jgi:hypothetical protein
MYEYSCYVESVESDEVRLCFKTAEGKLLVYTI